MICGKVFKYGDDVDTDVIIPARYLNITDMKLLSEHCMEDIDKDFIRNVKNGDVIVAGSNFGCGSSREHAPAVILESGVSLIVAASFARIFYRNAINIGLPILECPDAVDSFSSGDVLKADLSAGVIENVSTGETFQAKPFPTFIMDIISKGGILNCLS
ncbi:MAG: 3-isopropylmalate dehydratase small subunit [Clostridia bacterium]|nr:3-isopropylmalate dehydratase small subunit [Clostridia bacterium]